MTGGTGNTTGGGMFSNNPTTNAPTGGTQNPPGTSGGLFANTGTTAPQPTGNTAGGMFANNAQPTQGAPTGATNTTANPTGTTTNNLFAGNKPASTNPQGTTNPAPTSNLQPDIAGGTAGGLFSSGATTTTPNPTAGTTAPTTGGLFSGGIGGTTQPQAGQTAGALDKTGKPMDDSRPLSNSSCQQVAAE